MYHSMAASMPHLAFELQRELLREAEHQRLLREATLYARAQAQAAARERRLASRGSDAPLWRRVVRYVALAVSSARQRAAAAGPAV
jgi:RNA binding exosome subunit